MKRLSVAVLVCCVLVGLCGAGVVMAYDLPAVNLGFTSFMDGGPPAGPGFYFQQYFQYYHADKFTNAGGNQSPPGRLNAFVSLSQLIYQSDQPLLLGGKWGVDFIIPVAGFDLDSTPLTKNGAGIGDVLIGPYLQWGPVMGTNGPIFMHRIELQCITPTGRYNRSDNLNPGSNFFSFDPYWAATLFVMPRWTVDWRIHYLWNDQNDEPWIGFKGAKTLQAGQAVHLNFSSSYEVLPKKLQVGLNGYYLKQVTDTEIDGHDVSGRNEQVLGLGPGAVWHFSQNDHLFLNVYFEMAAENRPEGERVNLRYVHHF